MYDRTFYVISDENNFKRKLVANVEDCIGKTVTCLVSVLPLFEGEKDVLVIKNDKGNIVYVTLRGEKICSLFDGLWSPDNNWNDIREQMLAFKSE